MAAAIIEDGYDSEFRFGGRPLDPLCTLDTSGRVIYIGSFSKTLLPSLRLGFIIAPPSLHSAVHKAKFVCDWHAPTLTQVALARFIEEGGFIRRIRRVDVVYQERHAIVTNTLARDFRLSFMLFQDEQSGTRRTRLLRILRMSKKFAQMSQCPFPAGHRQGLRSDPAA